MEKEYLAILLEDMNNKFSIIMEGHTALSSQIAAVDQKLTERADLTDFKIGALSDRIDSVEKNLGNRIDAVAADLKAHRADTEAHGSKGLYVVREG